MEEQREIRRAEQMSGGAAFCDGCKKQIKAGPMIKWFWRQSGEDSWNDGYLDNELHSHYRDGCIGKVIQRIFTR